MILEEMLIYTKRAVITYQVYLTNKIHLAAQVDFVCIWATSFNLYHFTPTSSFNLPKYSNVSSKLITSVYFIHKSNKLAL
jgi:hypothetical protein